MKIFRMLSALAFVAALLFVGGTANAAETENDPTFVIPIAEPVLNESGCMAVPVNPYPEYLDYAVDVRDGVASLAVSVKPEHAIAVQVTTVARAEAVTALTFSLPVAAGCGVDGNLVNDPQFVILLTEQPYVGADGQLVLPSNPYPEYMAYAVEYVNGSAIVSAYVLPDHVASVDLTFTDRASAADVVTFAPVVLPVVPAEVPEGAETVEPSVTSPAAPVAGTDAVEPPVRSELAYTGPGTVFWATVGLLVSLAGVALVRYSLRMRRES